MIKKNLVNESFKKKQQYMEWFDAITMQNGWYIAETVKEWERTEDWIIR